MSTPSEISRWKVRAIDEDGQPVEIEVVQSGPDVGLVPPSGKPLWMDYQAQAELSSRLNWAGNAASYFPRSASTVREVA